MRTQGLNSNKYSRQNASFLGKMAALTYESFDNLPEKLEKYNAKHLSYFERDETECFICEMNKTIIISFRGTSSLTDFLTDLTYGFTDEGRGQAYTGFVLALDKVWEDLYFCLERIRAGKRILITGHSLGADLAILFSCRLWERQINNMTYAFAPARCLSKEYARWYNKNYRHMCHRYVNNNDVVPRVPPRAFGFGHVGTFHYFREDGIQDDDISWASKLLDRIEGRIKDIGKLGTDGIKDHSMSEYCDRLDIAVNGY